MQVKPFAAALVVTWFMLGSAHAVVIDQFDQPSDGSNQVVITNTTCAAFPCSASSSFNPGPGFGIIGGGRTLDTTVTGLRPTMPPVVWNTSAIISNGGAFTHSQTTGVAAHSTVLWNANGAGLNTNLLAAGANQFHLSVIAADQAAQWALTVSDGTHVATVQFGTGNNTSNFDLFVPFSAFTAANPLLDFSDVESIEFVANVTNDFAFDTTVDLLEAIPEPASMTLLGLGLAGLGWLARRRRAAD